MLLVLFLLFFSFSFSFIQGTTMKTVLSIVYFKLHHSSNSLFLANFNSLSTSFTCVSKIYSGELCDNCQRLKAVNCCWKAFCLRCLRKSSATHDEVAKILFKSNHSTKIWQTQKKTQICDSRSNELALFQISYIRLEKPSKESLQVATSDDLKKPQARLKMPTS